VPNFVVQFGINADPTVQQMYRGSSANIDDDPVTKKNKKGFVSFATSGPNTRSTQIFINLNDNFNLDEMGFAPFGKVVDSDMGVVQQFYSGYGEQPDQGRIQTDGANYLSQSFPQLTTFTGASIVPSGPSAAAGPSGPTMGQAMPGAPGVPMAAPQQPMAAPGQPMAAPGQPMAAPPQQMAMPGQQPMNQQPMNQQPWHGA